MLLYNCKGKRKEKEPQRKEVKKMTVKEMIKQLEQYDENMEIAMDEDEGLGTVAYIHIEDGMVVLED